MPSSSDPQIPNTNAPPQSVLPVKKTTPVQQTPAQQTPDQQTGIIQSQMGNPGKAMAIPDDYKPQAYEASGDELVSEQLSRLLGENSPYLQQSRTQAQQAAHARGLSNTAMAAGWGQEAAIKSALPIAQQDAGYFQNRGLADQQGIISSYLQRQQGAIESQLQKQGVYDQSYLMGQQAEYDSMLQKQIDDAKSVLQSEAATYQERLQAQIDLAEAERQKADIASKEGMQAKDIASQEGMQAKDIVSKEGMQAKDIVSKEGMQAKEIEASAYELGLQLTQQKELQTQALSAEMERL
ncbi:MAG: hypothetical protein WC340_17425, partial [Kiritimatiellia bacterium]